MSHLTIYRPMTPRDVASDFPAGDIKITSDIDSFLISSTSLEPYKSKLRFQLLTGDVKTIVSKNIKFTKYLQKRHDLFPNLAPRENSDESFLLIESESIDPNEDFNEFELGYIDNIPIYCVFQYDEASTFFLEKSTLPHDNIHHPKALVHRAFLENVILPAARDLPALSKSAKTGVASATSNVKNRYNIFPTDWPEFARSVTNHLRAASRNLAELCGITYVRFVMCLHGLRAAKPTAEQILSDLVALSHPHVHIIQIHRADEMEPPEGVAVLPCLDANSLHNFTVRHAYGRPYFSRINKYKLGFMHNFGAFNGYVTLLECNKIVTFIQAYNSAAKMSRVEPIGFFIMYLMLNCLQQFKTNDSRTENLAQTSRFKIQTLTKFIQTYCVQRVVLRLEEVLTIDVERHFNIRAQIERARVFDVSKRTILYNLLLGTQSIYRIANWTAHANKYIGEELAFMRHMSDPNLSVTLDILPCVPRNVLRAVFRAHYRLLFFAHGHDPVFNYDVVKAMYTGGNEGASLDRAGEIIELVEFYDENDVNQNAVFPCTFFNDLFPKEWTPVATFLYHVNVALPLENDANDISRYIFQVYASWSYCMHFLQPGARPAVSEIQPVLEPDALTLKYFFIRFANKRHNISQSPVHFKHVISFDKLLYHILIEPRTPFALLVRHNINLSSDMLESVKNALRTQLENYVQIFPSRVIVPSHDDIYTWSIIERTSQDQQLLKQAQQFMKTIKSRIRTCIQLHKRIRPDLILPLPLRPARKSQQTTQQQQQRRNSSNNDVAEHQQIVHAVVHAIPRDKHQPTQTAPANRSTQLPPPGAASQQDLDLIFSCPLTPPPTATDPDKIGEIHDDESEDNVPLIRRLVNQMRQQPSKEPPRRESTQATIEQTNVCDKRIHRRFTYDRDAALIKYALTIDANLLTLPQAYENLVETNRRLYRHYKSTDLAERLRKLAFGQLYYLPKSYHAFQPELTTIKNKIEEYEMSVLFSQISDMSLDPKKN